MITVVKNQVKATEDKIKIKSEDPTFSVPEDLKFDLETGNFLSTKIQKLINEVSEIVERIEYKEAKGKKHHEFFTTAQQCLIAYLLSKFWKFPVLSISQDTSTQAIFLAGLFNRNQKNTKTYWLNVKRNPKRVLSRFDNKKVVLNYFEELGDALLLEEVKRFIDSE